MSTDIELAIGDVVAVMAWGVWDMGAGAVDPDGEEELCDCVVREPVSTGSQGKLGALIGRIGEQGEPFLIGSQQLMVAVDNGTLFLGSNDNSGLCDGATPGSCYEDNRGSIDVCLMTAPALTAVGRTESSPVALSTVEPLLRGCEFTNLLECSTSVPIFIPDASYVVLTPSGFTVDFDNAENGSGVAFPFTPPLDVSGFNHLAVSGFSTGEFTFVVEYKVKENTQRSVVAASDHQSFPETRLTYTKTIPIVYCGQVDEIIINFIEKGEASKVVIESIQLISQVDTQ